MRITGGSLRGRVVKTVQGLGYRPVSSIVRQAVFDILFSEGIKLEKVIDVCCGSGIIGIEALSRGARDVVFLDNSKEIVELLCVNLKELCISGKVVCADVGWLFEQEELTANLVYFDAPYNDHFLLKRFLEMIGKVNFQILIIETHKDKKFSLTDSLCSRP